MNDPLFWNPLPDAAAWLSKRTGHDIDVRRLIDIVVSRGQLGDPRPTVIKAVCPPERKWARFVFPGDASPELLMRPRVPSMGDVPSSLIFVQWEHPEVIALCTNHLAMLLLHGYVDLMHDPSSEGMIWIIPFGEVYRATSEKCGINRVDLQALADGILATPNAPTDVEADESAQDASWVATAREYADEIWSARPKHTNPSAEDISRRIAKRFTEEGIAGARGPLAAATIERQALRGWKKPGK